MRQPSTSAPMPAGRRLVVVEDGVGGHSEGPVRGSADVTTTATARVFVFAPRSDERWAPHPSELDPGPDIA